MCVNAVEIYSLLIVLGRSSSFPSEQLLLNIPKVGTFLIASIHSLYLDYLMINVLIKDKCIIYEINALL